MKKLFALLISIFIIMSLVSAEGVSLLTPKIIFRVNLSDGQGVIDGKIGLKNEISEDLNISFDVSESISSMVEMSKENIVLKSNSEEWVDFKLNVDKAGTYSGDIVSIIPVQNSNPLGYATQIVIVVEGEANENSGITGSVIGMSKGVGIGVAIFLIIVIALFIFIRNKGRKRSDRSS